MDRGNSNEPEPTHAAWIALAVAIAGLILLVYGLLIAAGVNP
jgi:hypothetical protein